MAVTVIARRAARTLQTSTRLVTPLKHVENKTTQLALRQLNTSRVQFRMISTRNAFRGGVKKETTGSSFVKYAAKAAKATVYLTMGVSYSIIGYRVGECIKVIKEHVEAPSQVEQTSER